MRWVIAVCLLCLGAAAGAASELNWGAWAEEVRKKHPLGGRIYHPNYDRLLAFPTEKDGDPFSALPTNTGNLLFGEVHDNPTHHQLRAWLIGLLKSPPLEGRPGIVFEQIRADQTAALDQFKALADAGSGTADELFRLLEWDKSGWPPAQIYKPLFEAALAAKLRIYAGDPPRGRVRAVARGGLASLPPEERARLRLNEPMPEPLLKALREELAGSHCGLLPAEAIEGMAAAQRYRDAHLADALLAVAERHGPAILIAGNGHVRKDRGVPWHLELRAPHMHATAVLLLEVEEGKTDPASYVPRDPEGKPAADLVIFTPRTERGDPCEGMRKSKR
jgi:uncharacterized iron-regulated protein